MKTRVFEDVITEREYAMLNRKIPYLQAKYEWTQSNELMERLKEMPTAVCVSSEEELKQFGKDYGFELTPEGFKLDDNIVKERMKETVTSTMDVKTRYETGDFEIGKEQPQSIPSGNPPIRLNIGGGTHPIEGFVTVDRHWGGEAHPLKVPAEGCKYDYHTVDHLANQCDDRIL